MEQEMSTKPATSPQHDTTQEEPIGILVIAPEPNLRWGRWSVVLGVVTFVSGAFLIVMFVSLSRGGSAAPWGPINDALSALGNVILAVLVPWLSRGAARTPRTRGFVRLIVAACLAAAASGVLLVTHLLAFEPSTAISLVAIVLQSAWMIWLNRAWARDPRMPRRISMFGSAFGVGLLAGLTLVGASMLLPWGSALANALLIPGIALGGVAWILWPLWFILLGRHLGRGAQNR
jgi:hypothetical protein